MRRLFPLVVILAGCYTPIDAPAIPSALTIVAGDGQTGVPGFRLPGQAIVRLVDTDGRPIVGDTIIFTASDEYAVIEPVATVVTDSTGSAGVNWRLGSTLGHQTLVARAPGVPGVGAATFNATSRSNYMSSIDGGHAGMCGVDTQARLGCWIPPREGIADVTPRVVLASQPVRFAQVAMLFYGDTTRGCALAEAGRVWCFTLDSLASINGLAELPGGYPALSQLYSAGWEGDAYCALSGDGEGWCWGGNAYGQLGDGTQVGHATPQAVATSARFTQLDIGGVNVCGLTNAGEAWCWGLNDRFQAGAADGGRVVTSPVAINTALRFARVRSSGADDVGCGIIAGGGLYCWGAVGNELLYPLGSGAPPTAGPVAIAAATQGTDLVELGGLAVLFDRYGDLHWGGDPYLSANRLESGWRQFPIQSPLPVGLLSDIRLAHGELFICGTAALGGATLCPSGNGLVRSQHLISQKQPPVVGVPFP